MFIYSPGDWLCRCDGDVAGECVGECDGECSGGEFGMEYGGECDYDGD